jgi:hypothetical protein
MDPRAHSDHESFEGAITRSRGFVIFLILLSCWTLYLKFRHLSARFHVPHNFVVSFKEFGRAGAAIDLFFYLVVTLIGISFVKAAGNWLDRALFVGWIGPVVLNPLKMLVPRHASVVWWINLVLNLVFCLVSVAVFLRLSKINNSASSIAPESEQTP